MPSLLVLFIATGAFWWHCDAGNSLVRLPRKVNRCEFTCSAPQQCKEEGVRCLHRMECHYTSDEILSDCDCGLADKYEYLTPGIAEDASRTASPWHVGIYQIRTSTFYAHICTGILIFRDVVLTTATCMFDSETFRPIEPTSLKVAAKQTRDYLLDDIGQQKFDVVAVKVLKGYFGAHNGFDRNVALVFLSSPASRPGIHPICLYTHSKPPPEWQYIKLTGWGIAPVTNYSRSKTIKHARLNFTDILTCTKLHGSPLNRKVLTSDKFCFEFTEQANMAEEDSGGPGCIYWKGRHHLIGILSNKLKIDTKYGIATQLYRYLPWIDNEVRKTRKELTCQKLSNPFSCGEGLGCVPLNSLCDGLVDCPNGLDEEEDQCKIGGEDRCMVPDGKEIYTPESCKPGQTCKISRYASTGQSFIVTCPEGYSFGANIESASTLCFHSVWHPKPPKCHKLCRPVSSLSLDMACKYQGNSVSCEALLLPNTTIDFTCKQAYKKDEGALYRSPTQCREDGELLYLPTDCVPQCGAINTAFNALTLINQGVEAQQGTYPWLAALYWRENGDFIQRCGGTIIATNKILTAAHCLFNQTSEVPNDELAIATGKYHRYWHIKDDLDQRFKVRKKILGYGYNGIAGNYAMDIAVLVLNLHIELNVYNAPACLDLEGVYNGIQKNTFGYLAGWGNDENGVQPIRLHETTLGYMNLEDCRARYPRSKWLTADKICGIYVNGSGPQKGDSGGGLTFVHQGLHFLYGIVSVKPDDNNEFAAFTNILSHAQWLRNILTQED